MRFTNRRGVLADRLSTRPANRRGSKVTGRAAGTMVEMLEGRTMLASWTNLTNLAPAGVGSMVLLTDGTVLGQRAGVTNQWYKLTPSANGNYATGTWTTMASMSLQRLYTATNVLQDGRVWVLGGEYSGPSGTANWINSAEIYNPVTNSWSAAANHPEVQFGDDPTMLLPDGRVLAGSLTTAATYIYNPTTNAWSAGPTKLNGDRSDEETWVKAQDDRILSYNIFGSPQSTQTYNPATNTWQASGVTPAALHTPTGKELGPALQIPDGRIVQIGGLSANAIWTPGTNSWAALVSTPGGIGANDAPGALLPNGHILYAAGDTSTSFSPPTSLFDLDPVNNTVTAVAGAAGMNLNISAYTTRMLMLPTGQVLFTNSGQQLYIYNGDGAPADASKPVVTNVVWNGADYTLTGSQLNGISAGASYGDDAEMDSNYPIIRLTNEAGNVYYARSFNWNKTGVGVANGSTSVHFTLPAAIANGGVFKLEVSGAGINSKPVFAVLMGSATGGTVTVRQDPGNPANIQAFNGANLGSFPLAQFAEGIVANRNDGVAGNTVNIQDDLGAFTIYENGGVLGTLNVNGVTAAGTWTVNSAQFSRTGGLNVIYSSVFNAALTAGSGADTINVGDTAFNVLSIGGGGATDTINFLGTGSSTTFLTSSTGDDTVNVNTDNASTTTVTIAATQRVGALTIGNGGVMTVGYITPSQVLTCTALSIPGTGKLNMQTHDLIVDYSAGTPLPTIQTLIKNARNGGAWNGAGITTTSATAIIGLGAVEGTDYKGANGGTNFFDGIGIDNSVVLVKYTYYGDTDFNGKVDGADYARMDARFNQQVTLGNIGGWFNGDYDYNGKIDGTDYALIDAAFNGQSGVLRPSALPPAKGIAGAGRAGGLSLA